MCEEWAPVPRYEGIYSVSDTGRIRRDLGCRGSTAGRVLTCKVATNQYLYADLSKGNKKRRHLIHRVVAEAFIGPPPEPDSVINHLNGQKHDNRVSNLQWCSVAENVRHAFRTGLNKPRPARGAFNGRAVLSTAQVAVIRKLKGIVGARDLATLAGVSRSTVQQIHQGKKWPEELRVREMPDG